METLTGSMTSIHKDNDNQSTTAHDESDSTIIYDYQPDINNTEIKNRSTSATEIETKSEETKSTLKSTKNTIETEINPKDQKYSKGNQAMTDPTNNKKENTFEPQIKSSRNQNIKTVKIVLQKISTQEINEPLKTQDAKSEQRGKNKSKCTNRNTHTQLS